MSEIEDFENLEGLSLEKLIKLLDKAKDYRVEKYLEYTNADERVREISLKIVEVKEKK